MSYLHNIRPKLKKKENRRLQSPLKLYAPAHHHNGIHKNARPFSVDVAQQVLVPYPGYNEECNVKGFRRLVFIYLFIYFWLAGVSLSHRKVPGNRFIFCGIDYRKRASQDFPNDRLCRIQRQTQSRLMDIVSSIVYFYSQKSCFCIRC